MEVQISLLESRLERAKEKLNNSQEYIKDMVVQDINSNTFDERKAISELNKMSEIKAEIRELEYALELMKSIKKQ